MSASVALREVAETLRVEGGVFNDLAVNRAFAAMADRLDRRAAALEAVELVPANVEEPKPLVVVPVVPAKDK